MKYNLLLLVFAVFLFLGCSEKKNEDEQPVGPQSIAKVNSCVGCHTNYDHLKEVHTPDPPSSGGAGCGGETPHIEPYDRVYMAGDGFAQFQNTMHGKLECTYCHNGTDKTADKKIAHSGDFIKKPSAHAKEKCETCHPDVVAKTKNSLHAEGWGQKNMVSRRAGTGNVPHGFDALTDAMKAGYNENCGKCHATCGDCHVNRPKAGGGGLYKGHSFKKPDMVDHCTTCHTSRGGHAYFGVAVGTLPDVHLTKAGFTCVSCHSKNEIHGDGKSYNTRYEMQLLPECKDCHSGVAVSNKYHISHISTFSCQTCHSQDYNNCGSCHIGGEGARIHSYQGYKIGLNPIPEIKSTFKYSLLRRSLTAPDSWQNYGISDLANFADQPTYKYTTPHNIQKITSRTGFRNSLGSWETYSNCASACHISKNADGTYKNKELYLFEQDCLDWEKPANTKIVVDGKLPKNWIQ